MKSGAELIAEERRRQIEEEGWSLEHDRREHPTRELVLAAICYAAHPTPLVVSDVPGRPGCATVFHHAFPAWPWGSRWDGRERFGKVRRLQIAGALIAAEIDRLHSQPREERST